MAQPVWVLSVDLQTKTATFQSGMADAAKSARGAFSEIKNGSGEMTREVGGHMFEARHGVMLLGEEFGIHLPRALTSFIASIGPIGAAMKAAFPFLAIAVGATLLIEALVKMHEAGEKLTQDQMLFATAVQTAFNALDQRIIQAGIRADELRGDHLGALAKQLELIDRQSMAELVHSFGEISKAADIVFADLKTHWYSFSSGSTGAKHALDTFKASYDSLLAQGKDKEASDLLKGTRESAEKALTLIKQAKSAEGEKGTGSDAAWAAQLKYNEALLGLKQTGVKYDRDALASQEAIVGALEAQAGIESRVAALKKLEDSNATTSTKKTMDGEAARAARERAEAEKKAAEEAKQFYEQAYKGYVEVIDQGERETIMATKEGSAQRLAAIDAALKEEQKEQLTGTAYYKSLQLQRIETARQMALEEAKQTAEASRLVIENAEKMGELALAAEREHQALIDSGRRVSIQMRIAEETDAANQEYALKMTALSREMAALDKGENDYLNKLRALQNKGLQMTREHENQLAAIRDQAQEQQNKDTQTGLTQLENITASGLTQVIMGHKSFASAMDSIGDQVVSGMIRNALMSMMTLDMTKEKQAASAARSAYVTGESMGPAGLVLGPVFAAAAFAGVMAFEGGGVVPGVGVGDTVPAMLTPGEGVIPGGVMDGLSRMARSGDMGGKVSHHVHVRPVYHLQAMDSEGLARVLDKHSGQLQKHFEGVVRKLNR